jgi:hypothetical protein
LSLAFAEGGFGLVPLDLPVVDLGHHFVESAGENADFVLPVLPDAERQSLVRETLPIVSASPLTGRDIARWVKAVRRRARARLISRANPAVRVFAGQDVCGIRPSRKPG